MFLASERLRGRMDRRLEAVDPRVYSVFAMAGLAVMAYGMGAGRLKLAVGGGVISLLFAYVRRSVPDGSRT